MITVAEKIAKELEALKADFPSIEFLRGTDIEFTLNSMLLLSSSLKIERGTIKEVLEKYGSDKASLLRIATLYD